MSASVADPGSKRDAALYPVVIGFVPLVDAALLVIAREEGFAAAEGIDLILVRENSWAAIRDRLAVGHFDAAHMLAPAALAMQIGLGQPPCALAAPLALNRDGNAITVSRALAERLTAELAGTETPVTPGDTARVLAALVQERRTAGAEPLAVGTVFGYSGHTYQLGRWLGAAGLDLERDCRLVVIPPPMMVESLRDGRIDLFCAGSPWNSLAMAAGIGHVLHPCSAIVPNAVEKLLVLKPDRAEAAWLPGLVAALRHAAAFAADPANRDRIAGHLTKPAYLGVPAAIVAAVLAGTQTTLFPAPPTPWIRLDPDATVIAPDALDPLIGLMAAAGHLPDTRMAYEGARALTDLASRFPVSA